MASEKGVAFQAASIGVAVEVMRAYQAMALRFLGAWWSPALWTGAGAVRQLQGAALGVWSAGLAPLRRTAVANATRLAKTPLR